MASSSRLLLLRRGDHNSRLTEGFESLLDKESMTDVSITCGQQIIRAHRTVLSIFSPFFKRVFDSIQNPIHYPFIVLKDMPYTDLMAIIDLMYRGEVTVTQDQFSSLKQSAKVLEVSELSDIISSYEERNDIKPKIEENTSSGRNTRKRGRPKRYTEESDEDFKIDDTPPPATKRQQALQTSRAAARKTIVQTIPPKMVTMGRGGTNLSFSKQLPTATRGGHSAFSKPQTATRGGTSLALNKPQIGTRGGIKSTAPTRGRPSRQSAQYIDEDFNPALEMRRNSGRRGRAGRPPRTTSMTREDAGMPMATSLPVSLPEPLQVDLESIFPNYNLNDVSSSTSGSAKETVPVQFEQTIKQEPDSDSEVECIMSGTSPLPSGVMDDVPEITESSANEVSTNDNPQPDPQITEPQNPIGVEVPADNSSSLRDIGITPEVGRIEINLDDTADEPNILPPNVFIKTERSDSPVPEILESAEQEPTVSSVRRNSDNREEGLTNVNLQTVVTTSTQPTEISTTDSVTTSSATSSVSSANTVRRDTNVPLLRFIKTERISPTPVVQTSFQTIGQNNDESNSCEVSSDTPSVPVLTRIKIERISPKNVGNDSQEALNETENSSTINESSDVSTSLNQDLNVQITRVFSEHQSPPTHQSDGQTTEVTSNEGTNECTSSSTKEATDDSNRQQPVVDNSDANEIDVQDIAFDCFYSNDDQQMQTYSTEVGTSSASFPTNNNSFIGSNNGLSQSTDNHQNNQQFIESSADFTQIMANNSNQMSFTTTSATNSIITSSVPTQQFFAVNNTGNQQPINSNTFPIDNNNVVMNSPLHSDEECMLLDSPQQLTAYEVTIGSEPNLDDSMDNL